MRLGTKRAYISAADHQLALHALETEMRRARAAAVAEAVTAERERIAGAVLAAAPERTAGHKPGCGCTRRECVRNLAFSEAVTLIRRAPGETPRDREAAS